MFHLNIQFDLNIFSQGRDVHGKFQMNGFNPDEYAGMMSQKLDFLKEAGYKSHLALKTCLLLPCMPESTSLLKENSDFTALAKVTQWRNRSVLHQTSYQAFRACKLSESSFCKLIFQKLKSFWKIFSLLQIPKDTLSCQSVMSCSRRVPALTLMQIWWD